MSQIVTVARSLRMTRLSARVPRALALLLALVLIAAGLRATLSGPAPRAATARPPAPAATDHGAEAFAEGFARAYLTWDAKDAAKRQQALLPYLAGLDADGGLQPADGVSQQVLATSVVDDRRTADGRLVTLAVQTSQRELYLSVPVQRTADGSLAITAYPALVGPPATDDQAQPTQEEQVADTALVTVVDRAIGNYLTGNDDNLLADLTPDALVSPPRERLRVERVAGVTWVVQGRRVAVALRAADAQRTTWTLRYELDVVRRDRWYVRSAQVDPTFRGAR